jgi:general secretion pathway protein D
MMKCINSVWALAIAAMVVAYFAISASVSQAQESTTQPAATQPATEAVATSQPADDSASGDASTSGAAAQATQETVEPDAAAATAPAGEAPTAEGPAQTNPDELSLAFKDVPLEQISQFLAEQLQKPVIPHQTVKDKRITIVSTQTMPMKQAMEILREALRQNGVIIEESPRMINLRPISDARLTSLPIIDDGHSVSEIDDKALIVRKIFVAKHYNVTNLKDAIVPMLPDYGHVVADPNTRKLVVTDTVGNLQRIEQVIANLDVPMADQTITRIIEVKEADAAWVVSIVRLMIGGSPQNKPLVQSGPPNGAPVAVVAIEQSQGPIVLVPEVTRNWVIAVAPADTISRIEEWVKQLDRADEGSQEAFDVLPVLHADITEISQQLLQAVQSIPTEDLKQNLRVVPFAQARKVLVFGSDRGRALVRDLLNRLDVEDSENRTVREFILQHADAQTVADNIEAMFSTRQVQYSSRWGSAYSYQGAPAVRVTYDSIRNTVTVMTDPQRMAEIAALIEEQWDRPLDADQAQPRVYELKHADPIELRDLLQDMFSGRRQTSGPSWWPTTEETVPIGRLAGQFGFQAMPDSNSLIVTTKNPQNYSVIDELIVELDRPQKAGLPQMVELKHANAEDLAEQLNAMLSEPGTLAEVLRSKRDLTVRTRGAIYNNNQGSNNRPNEGEPQATDPGTMAFWWGRSRPRTDEKPTSNLIGKIRFVPVYRRNALMVLAPPAYIEPLEQLVIELDQPGMQVIIHAVIAEVQHDDLTTVGMRFASDPSLLADPRLLDQSIGGAVSTDFNQLFGGTYAIGNDTFGRTVFGANLSASILIQLLMREFGLKILFEPKLYTSDNQEAEFFDGQDVPVQTEQQSSAEATVLRTSFTYLPIGTRLRVRPHVTQEGEIDLTINLELSRIVPGESTLGNPIFDRRETSTHVVLHDGQTVMLSGIVRQEDFDDQRKVPLLGDIPLVGGIFRSKERAMRNRELIVFITPRVVETKPAAIDEAMQPYRDILERLKEEMRGSTEEIEPEALKEMESTQQLGEPEAGEHISSQSADEAQFEAPAN